MTHVYRQSGRTIIALVVALLSFCFCTLFIILPVGPNFYWKIALPLVAALICGLSLLAFFKRTQKSDAIFLKDRQLTLMVRKKDFYESADKLVLPMSKKPKKTLIRQVNVDDLAGFAVCDGKELGQGGYLTDMNVRQEVVPAIYTMYLFGGFAFARVANMSSKSKIILPETSSKHKKSEVPQSDREAFMSMQRYLLLKLKNGHEWVLKAEGYTPMDLLALLSELEALTGLKALCPTPLPAMDYPSYEKAFWKLAISYGIASFAFSLVTSLVLLLVPSPSNGVYYLEAILVFLSCFAGIFFSMLLGALAFDGKKVLPKLAKKYILWNGVMLLLVLSLVALVVKIL